MHSPLPVVINGPACPFICLILRHFRGLIHRFLSYPQALEGPPEALGGPSAPVGIQTPTLSNSPRLRVLLYVYTVWLSTGYPQKTGGRRGCGKAVDKSERGPGRDGRWTAGERQVPAERRGR